MLKKIGIDLDSTLNNLDKVWLDRYNNDYNDNIKEWSQWDMEKIVKPECGKKIYNYLHEKNFFLNLDIQPNAKEVVEQLSEDYELYVVTAYVPDTCIDKVNWIKKQKLNIDEKNIIFINNKGLLQLDYLIDDGPHNFENFKGTGLVYDMPYNKNIKNSSNRFRVKSWEDVDKFFNNERMVESVMYNIITDLSRNIIF